MADAALRHVASALARLPEGGRLVAITGAGFAPDNPAWTDAFVHLQERGRVVFDGRNLLEKRAVEDAGFAYLGVGRTPTPGRRRASDA